MKLYLQNMLDCVMLSLYMLRMIRAHPIYANSFSLSNKVLFNFLELCVGSCNGASSLERPWSVTAYAYKLEYSRSGRIELLCIQL